MAARRWVRMALTAALVSGASFAGSVSASGPSSTVHEPPYNWPGAFSYYAQPFVPVGDLNGDGVRDVLDVREYASEGSTTVQFVILARSGATGAVLWSIANNFPLSLGLWEQPVAARVGAAGKPGVILVRATRTLQRNGPTLYGIGLVGVDGQGRRLWTHHESGTADEQTGVAHHLPFLIAADQFDGRTSDWLLGRYDSTGGNQPTVTLAAVRVSSRDGSVIPIGEPVSAVGSEPKVIDAGDLSGDGHPDVLLVVPGSGGDSGVFARRGTDGAALWSNTTLALRAGADAVSVGYVHPSAVGQPVAEDVAVSSGPPASSQFMGTPARDPSAPTHGTVSLLDGADGTTVWSEPGDSAYPVQKAGVALQPAVGVVQTDITGDPVNTTATMTLTTYDDAGNQIYAMKVSTPPVTADPTTTTVAWSTVQPIGDVELDGSIDGYAQVWVDNGDQCDCPGERSIYFDGRDGSTLPGSYPTHQLGAGTTGAGEDFVTVTHNGDLAVSVTRPATGTVVFHRVIPRTSGLQYGDALGDPLPGSRCSDVYVYGGQRRQGIVAVLSPDGALLWQAVFRINSATPGNLYRSHESPSAATTCAK